MHGHLVSTFDPWRCTSDWKGRERRSCIFGASCLRRYILKVVTNFLFSPTIIEAVVVVWRRDVTYDWKKVKRQVINSPGRQFSADTCLLAGSGLRLGCELLVQRKWKKSFSKISNTVSLNRFLFIIIIIIFVAWNQIIVLNLNLHFWNKTNAYFLITNERVF